MANRTTGDRLNRLDAHQGLLTYAPPDLRSQRGNTFRSNAPVQSQKTPTVFAATSSLRGVVPAL